MPTHPSGTESAEFTTFMRAYQDMVFATAVRLTGRDAQAEDIAQEVFLRAYEHFHDLHSSPTAGGWLKTVTINLALNHVTRHRKRWRLLSDSVASDGGNEGLDPMPAAHAALATPDTQFAELDAEERRRMVDAALRRLPQHQRLVLVLYHFEDLSYQDIADKLQCSLTKVKTDIHRARAALLVFLERSGGTKETLGVPS